MAYSTLLVAVEQSCAPFSIAYDVGRSARARRLPQLKIENDAQDHNNRYEDPDDKLFTAAD
jgi:hypothetical protein